MTSERNEIEALASEFHRYGIHRLGAETLASAMWPYIAELARRLQPARVPAVPDYAIAAMSSMKDAAIEAHRLCYLAMLRHPEVETLGDDGELQKAIHAIVGASTPNYVPPGNGGREGVDWLEGPWRVSEDAHHIHNDNYDADVMLVLSGTFDSCQHQHDVANAIARRLASAPQPSIPGEVVQIGDDEDGQPRIVIHTTREAIRDYPAPLLFKRVLVQRTGSRGEGGDA